VHSLLSVGSCLPSIATDSPDRAFKIPGKGFETPW